MTITFPGESAQYRAARDRLLEREIGLRRAMEAVAAARRELPPGGPVPENYVFEGAGADGAPTEVRLSELFAPGKAPSPMSVAGGTCSSCPPPNSTSNRDYFGETADGSQVPMLNVFHRDGETIRHFWGAELTHGPSDPGQDHRSVGTL